MSTEAEGYVAFLASPELAGGVAKGVLRVSGAAFVFSGGDVEMAFPFQRIQLHTGGGEGDAVYFHDSQRPKVTLYTEDDEILEERVFARHPSLRAQVAAKLPGRSRGVFLMGALKFVAVFLALMVVVSVAVSQMTRIALMRVPPEWEEEYGAEAMEMISQGVTFAPRDEVVEALEDLANRIQSGRDVAFPRPSIHVYEDEDPNAFALPGGRIIIARGLLQAAERPEEVAGVLAHELAHLNERHFVRSIVAGSGPFAVARLLFGNEGGFLAALGEGSGLMLSQTFSREFEREADDLAWDYLVESNVDPRGLSEFLARIREPAHFHPGVFASHPPTEERIEHLEERWAEHRGAMEFESLDWRILAPRTFVK